MNKYKITSVLCCICIMLLLISCSKRNTNTVTELQAEQNFIEYYNKICNICNQNGFSINDLSADSSDTDISKSIIISLNENSEIKINLEYFAVKQNKGVESIKVDYEISNCSNIHDFDTKLYILILNTLSNNTLTVEFLNEFLSSEEADYSFKRKLLIKDKNALVQKIHYLDEVGDNQIIYTLDKNNKQLLSFTGFSENIQ